MTTPPIRDPEPETSAVENGSTADNEHTRSVRRSLVLSFAERYVAFIVQIATTAVLARLLTPADYGVFTVAAVIVSITQTLRDFGSMGFIIQERDLTPAHVRTVYGISLLIGAVAAGAVAAASGEVAALYDNAAVRNVLLVLSANFLLMPYCSLILVLLRREMRFDAILRINIAGAIATSAVSIVLAVLGFRALSLAWGSLAGSAATVAMGMFLRHARAYRLEPSLGEWRRIVSFGTVATAAVLVSSIGQEAPDLLIGRFLGVGPLGIYGRAAGLVAAFNRMVTSGVAPVAVSTLAMRHRSGADIREQFLAGTVMVTGLAWPFFAFLSLMAFPITRILFGDAWDAAVPVTRILSLSGAIAALANLNQLTLQATGAVNNNLRLHLFVQPLVLVAVTLAAQINLGTVAWAFVFGSALFVVASYHQLARLIGVSIYQAIAATKSSLIVAASSAVVPAVVFVVMPGESGAIWIPFLIAAIGAAAGWLLGVALARHPFLTEITSAVAAVRRWLLARQRVAGIRNAE